MNVTANHRTSSRRDHLTFLTSLSVPSSACSNFRLADAEYYSRNFWLFLMCLFFMAQRPLLNQALLVIKVSRLHSDTPPSVELFWKQTSRQTTNNIQNRQTSTHPRDSNPPTQQVSDRSPSLQAAWPPWSVWIAHIHAKILSIRSTLDFDILTFKTEHGNPDMLIM